MNKINLLKQLRHNYRFIRVKCLCKDNNRYEGVPIDPKWLTFDDFVKDNWIRYYKAIIKWKNYKRLSPTKKHKGALKLPKIRLTRKVKELGFTKENTVYTSHSDAIKYSKSSHKYIFEDKLLGTRDIKNILEKRGISLTLATIVYRLHNQQDLFKPGVKKYVLYKGKYLSIVKIADLNNLSYNVLKHNYYKYNDIKKAIRASKK